MACRDGNVETAARNSAAWVCRWSSIAWQTGTLAELQSSERLPSDDDDGVRWRIVTDWIDQPGGIRLEYVFFGSVRR